MLGGVQTHQQSSGREHMLSLPENFVVLRIVQLVFAVILLALGGFGAGAYNISYDGVDLILFTSIASLIICIYNIVAMTNNVKFYNYWAILALDLFACVFWLISFALLASEVATFSSDLDAVSTYCDYGYCYKRDLTSASHIAKRYVDFFIYRDVMAAASGLGGLMFILFLVSLIMVSVSLHRHRKAGGHCTVGPHEPKYDQHAAPAYPTAGQQQYPPQQQYTQQYPPQQQMSAA